MRHALRRLIVACAMVAPGLAAAQTYPARAIKFIVPFPAGGPADTLGRVFAEKLSAQIGQPVVIENRGGAGGVTGVGVVAKAEPDGYTIGIGSSGSLAINVALKEKMPYDPVKDLTLITQAVSAPELFVVSPALNVNSLTDFIARAKAEPGKLNFASTGPGGMPHLASELLKLTAKIDMVHVPYTGAAPAVNDLMGGHVNAMFADVPVLLGAVQSGKLKALAVGSKIRVPVLPDVPTTTEIGLPQVEADNWYGIVAPAGLPADVSAKLVAQSVAALRSSDVKDRLEKQGFGVVASTPAEFSAYVTYETQRWERVIKDGNIKMQ
ncbi:MAG: extra-cytoplasmic solute receptor BugT [Hyphomicrobiales bacterium]|nr:extra-cytoplasmic solute receptor BugT [Hyphomicrobiales bacterium]